MSTWTTIYDSPVTTDVPLVTTTETVVATVSGVNMPGPGRRINIAGWSQVTAGTGTTGITIRVRRGTDATGTLIGEGNPVTAGVANTQTSELDIETTDTPAGELANQSYVLTVQQVGASANGTMVQAKLTVTV